LSHLPVLFGQIIVGPAEHVSRGADIRRRRRRPGGGQVAARPVTGALGPFGHEVGRHGLQVVRPSDQREYVNEQRGQVQFVVEQLGVLVVPRERVMVIVPSVAARGHRHEHILGGIDVPTSVEKHETT